MSHPLSILDTVWLIIGLSGQICFAGRFFVQWLHSERQGKSVIPTAFWYMSIVGSVVLLAYAIRMHDPVFILGQGLGVLVYVRNLHLIYRERQADERQAGTVKV